MSEVKVTAHDVISFFETADLDLAALAFQVSGDKLTARKAGKQEVRERLKKARAARKPKVVAGTGAEAAGQAAEPVSA
jgi:hypothetical protein